MQIWDHKACQWSRQNIFEHFENNFFFFKFKKPINLHISQQRLEIEQNWWNLVINFSVYVHSKAFYNILKTFKISKNLNFKI